MQQPLILKPGNTDGVWFYGAIELWSTSYCAAQLGYTSKAATQTADKVMRRNGLLPCLRLTGRGGQNVWVAAQVNELNRENLNGRSNISQ
ncbi:MAG: hypothetical protein LC778_10200 [Acidobacteria bacterium]|nr:hypothetical protein [Acidobacteriota bacterium]